MKNVRFSYILVICGMVYGGVIMPSVLAGDFDSWQSRININIQNNYTVNMNNATLRINLARELPDFNKSDFYNNGSDIRFVDINGNNLTSFVEHPWKPDELFAVVWVNNFTILPNSNASLIMYYSNPNIVFTERPYDIIYENFTGDSTTQLGGWSGNVQFDGGTYFSANRSLKLHNDDASITPPQNASLNYSIEFYFYGQADNRGLQQGATNNIMVWES